MTTYVPTFCLDIEQLQIVVSFIPVCSGVLEVFTELSGVAGTTDICGKGLANGSIITKLAAGVAALRPINISGGHASTLFSLTLLIVAADIRLFIDGLLFILFIFSFAPSLFVRQVLWHCLHTGSVSGATGLDRTVTYRYRWRL